jgi:hypothetical protein
MADTKETNSSALITSLQHDTLSIILDRNAIDVLNKEAEFLSKSDLIPKHYQLKPANVAIALIRSAALKTDPFALMECSFVVHNRLGFESKFLIGLVNSHLAHHHDFKGPIQYEFSDGQGTIIEHPKQSDLTNEFQCVAYLDARKPGERRLEGPAVTFAMVKAEGWFGCTDLNDKDGHYGHKPSDVWEHGQITGTKWLPSKWLTMPFLMFQYRAAAFLTRTRFPELTLGLQSTEELGDVYDAETTARRVEPDPQPEPTGTGPVSGIVSPSAASPDNTHATEEKSRPETDATPDPAAAGSSRAASESKPTNEQLAHLWAVARELFGKTDADTQVRFILDKFFKLASTKALQSSQLPAFHKHMSDIAQSRSAAANA